MRITCPYCSDRDRREFTVLGESDLVRPDGMDADPHAMFEYVYLRRNVAGLHREYWYHGASCHAWLVVERDTRTHLVANVKPAREVTLARLEKMK